MMKRILILSVVMLMLLVNVCSADVYTKRISNLGAERFVQEYNDDTYLEHGRVNYFEAPRLATPANWQGKWPYDLWKTISVDSKYRLELTVDKQGYVTKVEIKYAQQLDFNNAEKILLEMLDTSSFLSKQQIHYLLSNVRNYGEYNRGDIVINNKISVEWLKFVRNNSVNVFGYSTFD
ncbi:MAG: hypothetical protein K6F01_09800 [Selenomonas sp.]|uniref:hypothetical protein n=1 Tax=Selenomonas sp. TaxID=2053611 RepID=UPI0025D6DE7F|nr:hypothetical protein [Selenomonas sp.]MCR5439709.1 hypothetical protein [Selenomonas sp.]